MMTFHRSLLAVSLVASIACTVEKGDDTGGSTSDPGTESAGSAETAGESGENPTTDINGGSESGTTAGETGEVDGGDACIDTPQVLAVDAASPLGFSAAEALEGKLGPRSSTLLFASEPTTLNDDIKGLMLPLTVELRHEGGEVRFIDSELNPEYEAGEEGFPQDCTDRLEIDVKFDFVTEAGEFNEHRDGVLTLTAVTRADLRVELLPPGVAGTFDPAAIYNPAEDPQWVVNSLEIGAIWDGELAGGNLLNEVQIGDGDDGIVGFGPIAGWGDQLF